jgi:hypothetical protein
MSPIIKDRAILAFKKESVEGTAVALAAADGKLLVWDLAMKPIPEFTIRNPVANTLSHRQSVRGKAFAECSFKFELKGEDSTADSVPSWGPILEAAGFDETVNAGVSVVYSPADDLGNFAIVPSLTMGVWMDGLKLVMRGARVTSLTFSCPVGGVITATATVKGVVVDPGEVAEAILAPTFPTALPEVLGQGVLTLDAVDFTGTTVEFNMGLKSAERYDPQLEFGCRSVSVTNREITCTLDPERELPSGKAYVNEMLANTVTDLAIEVGTGVTGHVITIDAARVQWEAADDTERDGLSTVGLTGRVLGPEAGGVDLTITKK